MQDAGPAPAIGDRCIRVRRRYHLHFPGLVYALTTLFLAVGAINSQNNLLFWAFGLAVAGMAVSGLLSGASLMGLELTREPIPPAFAGGEMVIRYRLTNRNKLFPAFALNISELAAPAQRKSPPPTWMKYISAPFAFVVKVGAGETVLARSVSIASARGEPTFDAVAVWTVFPFGLARKSVTFAAHRSAIVRPAPLPVPSAMRGVSARDTGAIESTPHRSVHGDEFYAVREYMPGDTLRAIAWRPSARRDQTIVRQFAARRAARVWLIPQLPQSDQPEGEKVLGRCAGFILETVKTGKAVGLLVPGQRVRAEPRSGRPHAEQLLDALARVSSTRPPTEPADQWPDGVLRTDSVVFVRADNTQNARAPAGAAPTAARTSP